MADRQPTRSRYRFDEFVVSPSRRVVLRSGREVRLIPRYFDLLVLLLERRNEAVHRRDILDVVWSDVVVSDGAVSQAIRTLRRALGDDPREPRYVRTLQRHGYRFVHPEVLEEADDGPLRREGVPPEPQVSDSTAAGDPFEAALGSLLRSDAPERQRLEAAQRLHGLGTAEALRRLDRRAGHAFGRALLRDARWDVPEAGDVPIVGQPAALSALIGLFGLRLRRALRLVGRRWLGGVLGAGLTGVLAGGLGGIVLRFGPGSVATDVVLGMLPVVGLVIGATGALGVALGLSIAEALVRSRRGTALVVLGAAGGAVVGAGAHVLGQWTLEGLLGRPLAPVAGGFEGLVIGGAVGLGYALSTPTLEGGMATPRGAARARAVLLTGLACAVATGLLAAMGRHLGAMSLEFMARSFPGSQVGLDPLARLLGEPAPGAVTSIVISIFEGLMFGTGLAFGITRRPR
jgi:DNA-binding winged helix-turn-helix (wHTH) protein